MSANLPLLYETLEFIEENPDLHDQAHWARQAPCGTRACFAGWAVVLGGGELLAENAFHSPYLHMARDQHGWVSSIRRTACNMLGLTDDQGSYLFDGANDIKAIRRQVRRITFEE